MWTYIRSEPQLWTVGFYDPDGKWQTDSDHDSPTDAANRVAFLNGGGNAQYDSTPRAGISSGDTALRGGHAKAIEEARQRGLMLVQLTPPALDRGLPHRRCPAI